MKFLVQSNNDCVICLYGCSNLLSRLESGMSLLVAHNCSCSRYIKFSQQLITTFEDIYSSSDLYKLLNKSKFYFYARDKKKGNFFLRSIGAYFIIIIRIFFVSVMFLLIYLILFTFSNRISAINISTNRIPRIETLYPLPTNNKMEMLAAHFRQNDVWEEGNMPMQLTEAEETKPEDLNSEDVEPIPTTIRNGHLFRTQDFHAYRIDPEGVNPHSEHHVFLVRHGNLKSIE